MDRCDFMFRGESLSSHGYTLCEFDKANSVSTVATDSQREITTAPMFGGRYYPILCSIYNGAFVAEMSICKIDESTNFIISPSEIAAIKRWLCSPTACELRMGGAGYEDIFWKGVFNVEEIHANDDCVGFLLTFTAVSPFGYKNTVTHKGSVVAGGTVSINDTSDEEGFLYPDIKITLKSNGDLKITNKFDNRMTVLKGCVNGEVITFSHLMQISSDKKNHILGDDFNYKFVRINNTYKQTLNELVFNLPCDYVISYNPIAKVVI